MQFQRGSVFIESMIAMGVIVVALIGAITMLSSSIGVTRVVADQHIAAGLAAEGIEIVKNKLDAEVFCGGGSFDNFSIKNVDYLGREIPPNQALYFIEDEGAYGYESTALLSGQTRFVRTITIGPPPRNGELRVNSVVEWTNRAGTFDINVEDHFFDWIPADERGGVLAGCS